MKTSRRRFLKISLWVSTFAVLATGSSGYYAYRNRKPLYFRYLELKLGRAKGRLKESEMKTVIALAKVIFPQSSGVMEDGIRALVEDRISNYEGFITIYRIAVKVLNHHSISKYDRKFEELSDVERAESVEELFDKRTDMSKNPLNMRGWSLRFKYLFAQMVDRRNLLIRKYVINDLKFMYYREYGSDLLKLDYTIGEPDGVF